MEKKRKRAEFRCPFSGGVDERGEVTMRRCPAFEPLPSWQCPLAVYTGDKDAMACAVAVLACDDSRRSGRWVPSASRLAFYEGEPVDPEAVKQMKRFSAKEGRDDV